MNDPTNKCLEKLGGYPTNFKQVSEIIVILSFPGGDLVENIRNQTIIRISGEIGRYFFTNGGYEFFGLPIGDEIWNSNEKCWSQEFENYTIKYSHKGKDTGFTFRHEKTIK